MYLPHDSADETTSISASILAELVSKTVDLMGTIEKLSVDLLVTNSSIVDIVRLPKGFLIQALTTREFEVLELMAHGLSNSAIAKQLAVTKKTVENYINRIYQTLNLVHEDYEQPRVQAVLDYLDFVLSNRTKSDELFPEDTDEFPVHTPPITDQFNRAA